MIDNRILRFDLLNSYEFENIINEIRNSRFPLAPENMIDFFLKEFKEYINKESYDKGYAAGEESDDWDNDDRYDEGYDEGYSEAENDLAQSALSQKDSNSYWIERFYSNKKLGEDR
jgi:hypothetical protein